VDRTGSGSCSVANDVISTSGEPPHSASARSGRNCVRLCTVTKILIVFNAGQGKTGFCYISRSPCYYSALFHWDLQYGQPGVTNIASTYTNPHPELYTGEGLYRKPRGK
jgi:hypothetical protein